MDKACVQSSGNVGLMEIFLLRVTHVDNTLSTNKYQVTVNSLRNLMESVGTEGAGEPWKMVRRCVDWNRKPL